MPPALHHDLQARLISYRAKRAFDPEKWINMKIEKLNDYMRKCGLKACVTSVSGGIDSAATLALCAKAMKVEGSPIQRNVGVCQPIHSSGWALQRGKENIAACGAEEIVVDQSDIHEMLQKKVDEAVGVQGKAFASGQLRSYMRTPVGYYVAQLLSQEGNPAIVMGTGNMDEDGYLAYFCKAGDGVVDVQLISDLHKSEVFKVASQLGVPSATVNAAPSADLWEGQTDEDELGITYDFIELLTGAFNPLSDEDKAKFEEGITGEARKQWDEWKVKAVTVHKRNAHKINGIVNL